MGHEIWVKSLEGFTLGLSASVFNLGALWLGIKIFAKPEDFQTVKIRTYLTVLSCLVKMPVFIGAGATARRIGATAPNYFLAGVFLVYSSLILWVTRTR